MELERENTFIKTNIMEEKRKDLIKRLGLKLKKEFQVEEEENTEEEEPVILRTLTKVLLRRLSVRVRPTRTMDFEDTKNLYYKR